jgi:hypothetical protein
MIRRSVHRSVQSLEAGVRDWIKSWNEKASPFRWTSTAYEVPDSLADI